MTELRQTSSMAYHSIANSTMTLCRNSVETPCKKTKVPSICSNRARASIDVGISLYNELSKVIAPEFGRDAMVDGDPEGQKVIYMTRSPLTTHTLGLGRRQNDE